MKPFIQLLAASALLAAIALPASSAPTTRPAALATSAPSVQESFTTPIDRTRIVMYECNVRAMSQNGTLAGVTARLDAIKSLGCNVVWLMPIHPVGLIKSVGGLGSPYSVRDYRAVDPEYGTLQDLRHLVAEAHKRGMEVLMDWVANHTSWDNAWITAHPEYYAHDANGNIISPPGTGWTDVAQLNYANTNLRSDMIANMEYWVAQAGIDGFRCDDAEAVPADFWTTALQNVRASAHGRPLIMLAEGGTTALANAKFDLLYGYNLYSAFQQVYDQNAPATNIRDAYNAEYPPSKTIRTCERLHYTTNHDETAFDNTPLGLFGGTNGSLAAYAIAAWHGGAVLVYSGQEIGWPVMLPFFSLSPINWTTGGSMAAKYTEILSIRQRIPALLYGEVTDFSTTSAAVFLRSYGGPDTRDALVLANVRNNSTLISLSTTLRGTWKNERTGANETLNATLPLTAYEYRIYTRPSRLKPDSSGK